MAPPRSVSPRAHARLERAPEKAATLPHPVQGLDHAEPLNVDGGAARAAERAAQGLPRGVVSEAALLRLALLLRDARRREAGR